MIAGGPTKGSRIRIARLAAAAVFGLCLALANTTGSRADEKGLLAEAVALYKGDETSLVDMKAIQDILDRIVADHSSSTIAVDVLFRNPVGGIDVAKLDQRLRDDRRARRSSMEASSVDGNAAEPGGQVAPTDSDAMMPQELSTSGPEASVDTPPLAPATEQSEAALALDKAAVRDIQARLLVLGFDPNGIDGSIGRGTRAAVSAWQVSVGAPATGFLETTQLQKLTAMSQPVLSDWLTSAENQRLYQPPPPIPLTAENVSGVWSYTSSCGAKSRAPGRKSTGEMQIVLGGNGTFSGPARNSQGFNGTISGQLSDRSVRGRLDWGLLVGRVDFTGRIKDDSLTLVGRDNFGCSFVTTKQ